MKERLGSLRTATVLVVVLSNILIGSAQQTTGESARVDRLVALAKLWAAVEYFHPYLAYRENIDWDAALVRAIPKVDAARNGAEYSAAVEGMLNELGDPVTRVLDVPVSAPANSSPSAERQPTFQKNADGILVVAMTNYADLEDFNGAMEKLEALKKELPTARAVVFDMRASVVPSEAEQGWASFEIAESGLAGELTTVSLDMPGERRRMHVGYAPQDGTASNYSSGFYLQGRQSIKPETGAKDMPVVFLINPHADVPEMALGFQASGKGAIVSEGASNEDGAVSTQIVELPDGIRAQIRLGELVYADGTSGFAPNLTAPASGEKGEQNPALQAAIQLAKTGKFSPPPRARLAEQATPARDKTYADMEYPPTEYRVLAAFRLWAVINYFYPYKNLMGEDWNEILRQFIPRLESARDALEYQLAVVEMATHIHDTHVNVTNPFLNKYFGEGRAPIRIRIIEGQPLITGFINADEAKEDGLEIGDVVLKVDGEDANRLIAERLKYTAHSTQEGGLFLAADRGLTWGAADKPAIYTIRDLQDRVREVKVVRKVEYKGAGSTVGGRTGEVMRLLPGNIGYADLDRLLPSQVDEMFEKFKDCPAIIFDVRGYPNRTAWTIAPRLTDRTDVVGAMFRRRIPMSPDLPNGEIFSSQDVTTFLQRIPHTDKWRYHGRTVMLMDERTISQAEHTGLFFEAANGTKFIGSPTQGANGDVTGLFLPGGMYVRFSGQGVWHADGRQLQRVGLQPDVEVRPTLAGIRAGRDEVLDAAVDYLGKADK